MSASDGPVAQLEPIPAIKIRKSRKAPSVKAAVIASRIQGTSKLQISKDLGMSKNTVNRIIEEANLDQLMEDGRLQTMHRLPQALKTLDIRLEKNSESAAIWLLDKCFDNAGKGAKPADQGLTLAIQNLMGNITVQASPNQQDNAVKAIDITPQETQSLAVDSSHNSTEKA